MRKAPWILGVLLLLAAPGHATTLLWMDVGDLTRNSTAVLQGTVVAQETLSDLPGVPLNRVTVDVGEAFKGGIEGSVLVNNPGFAGAPVFHVGDELILFVSSRNGSNVITGFQQGSFKIVTRPSGEKVLDRPIPSRDKALSGVRSVDALVDEIRGAAAGEGRP